MKTTVSILLFIFALSFSAMAQMTPAASSSTDASAAPKKRPPVFKANKEQIMQAQKTLKDKGMYTGEQTGKLDDATRAALSKYQTAEAMPSTGTLNQATLEKMSIALTDKQKMIPVSEKSSMTPEKSASEKTAKPKSAGVFRANKDQITQAQKMLKDKGMYSGEANGKLDDATRDGLKKFQDANGVKVTGTLNHETLEKMNIALTDKQKAMVAAMTMPSK